LFVYFVLKTILLAFIVIVTVVTDSYSQVSIILNIQHRYNNIIRIRRIISILYKYGIVMGMVTGFGQKYCIITTFKSEDLFSRYFFDYRRIYDIPNQIEIMRTHKSKKKNKQTIY